MKIKWTNTYSHESGYVKYVDYKNKHFVNTFTIEEAKSFVSTAAAEKAIKKLIEYGEDRNNKFEVVS